ncbi:hypothetical protein DWB68_01305 [Galactobacter valiniphilus]|uniref:GNAT family N-acetyltransferase n=1 Tax=Galactobacter valiniphilus TaxID=2676122 RepID=A0A399JEB6_9MICC|nr:hypothetical protein [Galactobacter valiniphilus]RII43574.1 hypothetical protein DWB68_01305 [Galactobacter valiniphilus]
MEELFVLAWAAGQHLMADAVASGNSGSLGPHHKLGFENAGTLKRVGTKFRRRLDPRYLTLRPNDAATPA